MYKAITTAAISIMILVAHPITIASQSYKSLWTKADKAYADGLPKTALQHIDKIISLSQRDANSPQLLKAMLTRMIVGQEISEDSAKAMIPRIERMAAQQTADADKCLWHMALGWLYTQQESRHDPLDRKSVV